VSFHRPHSPYDPPARLLNATTPADVPHTYVCSGSGPGQDWDAIYGTAPQCGPTDPDAWCGDMPADVSDWGWAGGGGGGGGR